ncbi:MAG: ATP-binding protein [Deltaproteobacteria bacterium]|nr:ATP-binding protein [Deltaproteobacteria bacterium]
MIHRHIVNELKTVLTEYPVVTILGPRQAGKTTLAKSMAGYQYSNLEHPETRVLAESDPVAYLGRFDGNVIIDEIQRVPDLLSYIQTIVDEDDRPGRFILTGSYQLRLREAVSQSLAGRTAILHLMPLSVAELLDAGLDQGTFDDYCIKGFLPRIYDKGLRPGRAYANYYQTYVERDVRQLIQLKDMTAFEALLKLMAGRVGQLMDYHSIAQDVGVSPKTIKNWISILEASFIVFKLPPYFKNFGKRVIKAPKYYFTDVGLLCFLLGIRQKTHVVRDPLVGGIFENLVVLECVKALMNKGEMADLYFFRDSNKNEVDLLYAKGRQLVPVEIKAAATFSPFFLRGLKKMATTIKQVTHAYLVYNGQPLSLSDNTDAITFKSVHTIFK